MDTCFWKAQRFGERESSRVETAMSDVRKDTISRNLTRILKTGPMHVKSDQKNVIDK